MLKLRCKQEDSNPAAVLAHHAAVDVIGGHFESASRGQQPRKCPAPTLHEVICIRNELRARAGPDALMLALFEVVASDTLIPPKAKASSIVLRSSTDASL